VLTSARYDSPTPSLAPTRAHIGLDRSLAGRSVKSAFGISPRSANSICRGASHIVEQEAEGLES